MNSLLDQTLRVPHEQQRKNFRASQKHIERDVGYLNAAVNELGQRTRENGGLPIEIAEVAEMQQQLDGVIGRMQGLKRKLGSLHAEETSLSEQTKRRLTQLEAVGTVVSPNDPQYERWARLRFDMLIVDYLLRIGHCDVAARVAEHKNITDLVDVPAITLCHHISDSLRHGGTNECLIWCTENKQVLRKARSNLEFEVRLQDYVELVRAGRHVEAIVYAKKFFTQHIEGHLEEIQRAAALLAFPSQTDCQPYMELYSAARWSYLADAFVATYYSLFNLPSPSLLQIALSAGLAALKTPSCYSSVTPSSSNTASSTTSLCPICSTELNELARGVPFAHHVRSFVDTDPVVLPNGRIYGRRKLEDFAEKANVGPGLVRDPTTGDEWDWDVIRKVYVM